ncbi:MAG: hypothetical protein HON90_01260 [Halobacteriovoraceae bacterium]|jgi:3-methyladenine DNA glycosylase AlkC|nr:hypothetical protein [Halobacteriovoraceae bacterium]
MEPFKNIFNPKSLKKFSHQLEHSFGKQFDAKKYHKNVLKTLESLELKDRVRLMSHELHLSLPASYKKNIQSLINSLAEVGKENGVTGFMTWPLLQYIEDYGHDDFNTSFKGMYEMTKRFSAEFAIRPYLNHNDIAVFKQLHLWINDPCEHIRRLCSEGIRPNLPWGLKVVSINNNLSRNILFLEKLKDDPSLYVRKSVANHLNDISRLDEKLLLKTLTKWSKEKKSKERQWIIRHASRTLLKQGHPKALLLHGYHRCDEVRATNMKLSHKLIQEGDFITLSFKLVNKSKQAHKLLVDYIVDFPKKDGRFSAKAFRLKDFIIGEDEVVSIIKKISFKKVTTRKHYSGRHHISLQINGVTGKKLGFELNV